MDSTNGGLSPSERQRQTAAEIARKKVLAAYSSDPKNAEVANTSSMKQAPIKTTSATPEDWKKYHSAWQNYYQRYYSEYYAKAAKQYVETEKMKHERAKADEKNMISDAGVIASGPSVDEEQEVEISLRERIRRKAEKQAKHSRKHRKLIPIAIGVTLTLGVLFLEYNRMIFAPIMAYVSPGNSSDEGISSIDPTVAIAVHQDPTLIIPKINVEVPIHLGISNDTKTVNDAMNNGVAQFAIPGANAMPGQIGNLVISGHSAGDIYSNNQYKFIFSGLERLKEDDLIYVDYQSVRYTYKVTKFETVEPTNVSALVYETTKPMLTLVTCTPLGTSRYRLLVSAEQVNPLPDGSIQESAPVESQPEESNQEAMPENEPSFFQGIWNWLTGQS